MNNLNQDNINLKMELDMYKKYIMKQANRTEKLVEENKRLCSKCYGPYELVQKQSSEIAELKNVLEAANSSCRQWEEQVRMERLKNTKLQQEVVNQKVDTERLSHELREQKKQNIMDKSIFESMQIQYSKLLSEKEDIENELNMQRVLSADMAERNKKLEKEALMTQNERVRNEELRRFSVHTIQEDLQPGPSHSHSYRPSYFDNNHQYEPN